MLKQHQASQVGFIDLPGFIGFQDKEKGVPGLRNARAKGKKLGRPRKAVDRSRIASLRRVGRSWAAIGQELGVGEGTVRRSARNQ